MSQSQEKFITHILMELRILGSGQAASAEDYNAIEERLKPLFAELAQPSVGVSVANFDQIDDALFPSLVIFFANRCAEMFGVQRDYAAELAAIERMKEVNSDHVAHFNLKFDRIV